MKNESEKTIREFRCDQVLINGKQQSSLINSECDITPGKYSVIAILNLPPFVKDEVTELYIRFVFKNLVMDSYFIETEIFVTFNGDAPTSNVISFTYPELYNNSE